MPRCPRQGWVVGVDQQAGHGVHGVHGVRVVLAVVVRGHAELGEGDHGGVRHTDVHSDSKWPRGRELVGNRSDGRRDYRAQGDDHDGCEKHPRKSHHLWA